MNLRGGLEVVRELTGAKKKTTNYQYQLVTQVSLMAVTACDFHIPAACFPVFVCVVFTNKEHRFPHEAILYRRQQRGKEFIRYPTRMQFMT